MEKDKLEKAAKREAYDNYDRSYNDRRDGFIKGAEYLMAQPLAERLRKEERENIKELHDNFAQLAIRNESTPDKSKGNSMCLLLEAVFGNEMFENKE